MQAEKIKVVLIEDSGLMRILISEIIRSDEMLSLLATAGNGKDGVDKIHALKPDVVVTDMVMPVYDGLYVVEQVMKGTRIPVILLSSLEREDQTIFEALNAGAFDFIAKPRDQNAQQYGLNTLIRAAAGSRNVSRTVSKNCHPHTFTDNLQYDVVAIGSSTGGPGAIESILENLPKNFAVPVVVAQHMPEHFITTFAERLNSKNLLRVKIAEDGEILNGRTMYLAPGTSNLRVVREHDNRYMFRYTDRVFTEFNSPSVDCLLESVADAAGNRSIGVVLTGMGRDGSMGLRKIRYAGGLTIAQDESTSIVFGMPKAAQDAGAASHVLKLFEIPGFIVSCLS